MIDYRVRLEAFEGPLDLLLFLIRREEVDIHDIPVARIAEQYIAYLQGIERIDIDLAGEFLLMAATLMEIKSRVLAGPKPSASDDHAAADAADPRAELVRQLLEYKRNRDLADALESRLREWERRAPAARALVPQIPVQADPDAAIDLDDITLMDLVEAFQKIVESVNFAALGAHEVQDDGTPIELHAADLLDHVLRSASGSLTLRSVFEGRTRSEMLGLFLAMLELVRQRKVLVRQEGESITLAPAPADETAPPAEPAAS